MPRKNNRRAAKQRVASPPLDPERVRRGAAWVVTTPDGAWFVRTVTAAGAVKVYRCPGCDHEIAPGMPHVVVWPADDIGHVSYGQGRIDDRRHWHTACWSARSRRLR